MEEHFSFGYWLRRQRLARDLRQADFAQQLGIASVTLRKIEADERRPSLQLITRVADLLTLSEAERARLLQVARADLSPSALPLLKRAHADLAEIARNPLLPQPNLSSSPTPLFGQRRAEVIKLGETMDAEHRYDSLTEREQEILLYLAQRLSNQEIADTLHLSLKTIKWYNTQIFEKLGVKKRTEAIRLLGMLPGKSVPPPRASFPVQGTPFIGRKIELQDLESLLSDSSVRIITILGPGGMGKTRLAIEAALHSTVQFAAGAFFVPLAHIEAPADLVTAIGSAVTLSFAGTGEPQQQLLDFLRHQALLLVLDNFEHLVEQALLITTLIEAAPGVKVLITSREKLNLSGETVYALGGLNVPDTGADPLSFDAVQLFLQRARRAHHAFAADDPSNLMRIAQLTQGMPLGLVLAAAWADVLSPAQIADEISHSIEVLYQETRDIPLRHRSMRAVFDPTWMHLTQVQQAVFMKLSVFRGGFTREAAEVVAGADLRMLAVLTGKSLIQLQPNRRYTIHNLLHQYSETHLEHTDEAPTAHAAHGSFFLDFLVQRESDVKGQRQSVALAEINDDFENIRIAWLWALEHKQFDAIDRALENMAIGGELAGRLLETHSLLQHSVDAVPDEAQLLRERIIVRLARLNLALSHNDSGEEITEMCGHMRKRGDVGELAWCLWVLGDQAAMKGYDEQAQRFYEELIGLCRTTGNAYLLAHGLTGIAWRYANAGHVERAVAVLRESIAIRRRIGDVKDLAYVTVQLSWMLFDLLQDAQAAEQLIDEQIAFQHDIATHSILSLLLGFKAILACWRSDPDAAQIHAQRGVDLARSQNYLGGKSACQGVLGMIACLRGNYAHAQVACQDVVKSGFVTMSAFPPVWAISLAWYGLGDAVRSRSYLAVAIQIACRFKSPTFQSISLVLAAVVLLCRHDPERAVAYLGLSCAPPAHLTRWLHQWPLLTTIYAQLHAHLGGEAYSAAWARGQAFDLNTEAAKVLAELQAWRYDAVGY